MKNTSWPGQNDTRLFQAFPVPTWWSFLFSNTSAFNSTHLPASMYNPASTKIFRYGFVCLIWTLPFLKHLFWIGTIPTFLYFLSALTMAVVSQYLIFRSLHVMLYTTLVNWFCWKMTWQKWVLFKCTQSDSLWGHTKSCVGTASKWHAMLWEQSSEGPGVFEASVSLPPHTMYNMLCKHSQFLYFNRAVLLCVFSHLFHLLLPLFTSLMPTFPFYHLSTPSGFLPRINSLLWNSLADIRMQISANSVEVHYSNSLCCSLLC